MVDAATEVVTVEILGQRYPIRSSLDVAYVIDLANYVDRKMRTASDRTTGSDSVRVAVLAALNIADEYFRCKDEHSNTGNDAHQLTVELEQLVDEALAQTG